VSKLTQVMAAARRFAVWLLPAARRDWLAALWAEAEEVPPGLTRLAWRAGGVWVLARGALMPRRLVRVGLFAAASAGAAWVAWPQLGVGHVAEGRFNAIAPVLVLAVLPLLSRRFFGAASPGRIGGSLRVLCYAAILALLSAWTILMVFSSLLPVKPAYQRIFCNDRCTGVPGRSSGGPTWQAEILIMLLILGYAGVTLFLTSRRSQVTRSTLAIGTGTGLLFGVVMYAVDRSGSARWPPTHGCRARRPAHWWRWPGSCCSAARPRPPCWPGGGAADPMAPSRPATPESGRALPPACWRTGPQRWPSLLSARARRC